jgi:hypothetical protein
MPNDTVDELNNILYRAQHAHFGSAHARDLRCEVKGSQLLSNYAIKIGQSNRQSCNLEAAKDILRECAKLRGEQRILLFAAVIYGEKDILKKVTQHKIAYPLVEMLQRISFAASKLAPSRSVSLVFDEQLAARDVAISIRRFVAGRHLANVSHYPLIAVSNVSPGIQLADLGAYILGRRAAGDVRFEDWVNRLKKLQWTDTMNGRKRNGIKRWDSDGRGRVSLRRKW